MQFPHFLLTLHFVSLLLATGFVGLASAVPPAFPNASILQRAEAQRLGKPARITNSIDMKLVLIPAGEFIMGSPENESGRRSDEDQHPVTLTQAFYLSETEVTQAQWMALKNKNPSFFEGDNYPVDTVNWIEAVEFCHLLSEKEGATYRLPTEAEWEYACRAGTTTPYNTGRTLGTDQANYNGQIGGRKDKGKRGEFRDEATKVRTFSPNAWGLYDMHANVWEWCSDWHGIYPKRKVVDPKGPETGTLRVVRGGCWVNAQRISRSANRGKAKPNRWNFNFGFRIVRDLN